MRWTVFWILVVAGGASVSAVEPTRYEAIDTLSERAAAGQPRTSGNELIDAAGYEPREFTVRVAPPEGQEAGPDMVVRFPSPRPDPRADATVNTVVLEWYMAHDGGVPLRRAPAVLVLHTLDRRLHISQAIARVLASEGIHGFVMHSPGYGQRTYDRYRPYGERFFERSAQSIADARRARDAIAALPPVEPGRISIQGTSLGGFQAVAAASMDAPFEYNFFYLAGADLCGVLTEGVREAQWVRESLRRHGIDDDKLRELCRPLEPARAAHRLDPRRTWLFSAREDQVVPPRFSLKLAQAIGLDEAHHVQLHGDHYLALLHVEWISRQMARIIQTGAPPAPPEK